MVTDQQGNSLAGATPQAAEHFDRAITAFSLYRGDPISAIDSAIAEAPDFAMAYVAKAHMLASATEPGFTAQAGEIVHKLKAMRLGAREASHVQALEKQIGGNWTDAALLLDMHNVRYPYDILGLQCGHLMDFFRGNARNLRDRLARVMPKWRPDMPGYPVLLGMYAFGLEEAGDYAKAEDYGCQAVTLEPFDSWAHHAVAHVLEMQGRTEDGVDWMRARQAYWAEEANFFKVHNWWHYGLYLMALGQTDDALAIYDTHIHESHHSTALGLIDASAMLWRFHLVGVDVTDRWSGIAGFWDAHADGRSYTFNDWHAAMAYLGAGRETDVARIIADFQRNGVDHAEVDEWTLRTALPLVQGFAAFWHEDYSTAIQKLYGARFIANQFGGSHAQRDIIDLTLLEAALRADDADLAEALAHERLALKPDDAINRGFLARSRKCRAP